MSDSLVDSKQEAKQQFGWRAYGSSVARYEQIFSLEHGTLERKVQELRLQNVNVNALDLMGEGEVLRNLPIDSGLAFTLKDERNAEKRSIDEQKNIDLLTGNILSKGPWQTMKQRVFNIILCAPQAGVEFLPYDKELNFWVLQNIWQILSPQEGILYAQFSPYISGSESYFKKLSKVEGVAINFIPQDEYKAWPVVHVKRSPEAPDLLPTFLEG